MIKPTKIREKLIIDNGYLKVKQSFFKIRNNKTSNHLILSHSKKETKSIFILPLLENGDLLYIKEFRIAPNRVITGFPGGGKEDGISLIENAKKELKEETGYYSNQIELLTQCALDNHMEGDAYMYIAKDCQQLKSGSNLEIGEYIEVNECSTEEFEEMIHSGIINSTRAIAMFYLAKSKGYFK